MPIVMKGKLTPGKEYEQHLDKPAIQTVAKMAKGTIEVAHKKGGGDPIISTKDEVLPGPAHPLPVDQIATVHCSASMTINLGNYESTKITVGVTLPCLATKEALDETYERGSDWVSEKLSAGMDNVKGSA